MICTQLYLRKDAHRRLKALAAEQGTTLSELVRQAVDAHFLQARDHGRRVEALDRAVGLWRERDDIDDEHDWLRAARSDGARMGWADRE